MISHWIVIVGIALVGAALLQRQVRAKQYQSTASEIGLKFDGSGLPSDLPIASAPFYAITDQVSNVSVGTFDNRETVIFDFHANHGDVGYKQSIVAVKSQCSIPTMTTIWKASEIQCLRLGEWIIMYRQRVEVPVRKAKEFVDECSELMRYIESNQFPIP